MGMRIPSGSLEKGSCIRAAEGRLDGLVSHLDEELWD